MIWSSTLLACALTVAGIVRQVTWLFVVDARGCWPVLCRPADERYPGTHGLVPPAGEIAGAATGRAADAEGVDLHRTMASHNRWWRGPALMAHNRTHASRKCGVPGRIVLPCSHLDNVSTSQVHDGLPFLAGVHHNRRLDPGRDVPHHKRVAVGTLDDLAIAKELNKGNALGKRLASLSQRWPSSTTSLSNPWR